MARMRVPLIVMYSCASLAAVCFVMLVMAGVTVDAQPDSWYYCGKDPMQAPPVIPPPSSKKTAVLTQLSLVIRHGDRSTFGWYPKPGTFGSKRLCWPNDTNKWECDLNYETVPGPGRTNDTRVPPTTIFRKLYEDNENVLQGNCDVGQLTKKGYEQQLTNGKMIRDYYIRKIGFLPDDLTTRDLRQFYVRSDDEPRTVMSAQSLFLGLYPFAKRNETIIVDIHTRSDALNNMVTNSARCPRLSQVHSAATQSAGYKSILDTYATPLKKKLAKIFNTAVTTDQQLEDISDCCNAYFCHDFPLHRGINLTVIKEMEVVDVLVENYMNGYPNTTYNSKLGIGFLIHEIYSHMNATVKNKTQAKFLLYSGHDTTILPLLSAFKMPLKQWVPYASVLVWELYHVTAGQTGTPYAVRMIFNQQELLIPGCDDVLCSWDIFAKIAEQLYTLDYERDCAPQ
eukprot:TRINITY_DN1732_c0_g1_i1.p1 TRINITY_DN1732_c0_g1~~TRINITY_DN1732_c0_g1_i1.p1  ORF type:complete len:453 (+),score=45.86 TRINITY_DN1732_c0_g1_i1:109-1467(+)